MRSLWIGKARWLSLPLALVGLLLGVAILATGVALAADAPPGLTHPAEGRDDCLICHQAGSGAEAVPASHAAYQNGTCLGCHAVGGGPRPAAPSAPLAQTASTLPAPMQMPEPMPIEADTCLLCHESPGLSTRLPSGEVLSIYVEGEKMAAGVHGEKLQCVDCHTTLTTFPHPKVDAKTKRQFQVAQLESCKSCHGDIYATYLDSVHGRALTLENNVDVPLCGDCHGTHDQKAADSPSYRLNSPEMCANCHSNAEIMDRYGLSSNVFRTYAQDFHGATVMVAQKESMSQQVDQAVCYDCHGAHDVKSFKGGDPAEVQRAVLGACQKCHPNAGESFPQSWLGHYDLSLERAPAAWIARAWYLAFIPFMVGGMAIHIGADLYQWRRRKK